MPEGDNVWQTARRLGALSGEELTRTDFRVPSVATVDLSGRRVLETVSRGKHLLTRVEGGTTIHTHLKMEGRWDVQPAGARWRRPGHEARVVLRTPTHEAIGYSVLLDVVPTAEEDRLVGHLGPDLLGPDWDEDEAVRRIEQSPDLSIGEALLDQRNLAGLGNVYKSEALFLCGLDPHLRVGDVPDVRKVVVLGHRLINANRDRPARVTTGNPRRGQQYWVYGRAGQPCRRCGTRIESGEQGDAGVERITYWCPSCQP
ncbi:DNA-formamidopyrimidine glycosylase family protein [Nocardioides pocheonensis]|uniref:DNA-(apurinic or apyrimidinic site) lyase n=1 Tax=Nocardioides pocheonensis TaxID=661485 RepID=A0A3N0GW69_9ACTN|nr:DNA-formamidopyrimidine glycosylase family protein [Nocardioides pocheonensis]RNM16400.1 Fpg/Nei family DNA glycosylase [Nocardioides pocheonensis]